MKVIRDLGKEVIRDLVRVFLDYGGRSQNEVGWGEQWRLREERQCTTFQNKLMVAGERQDFFKNWNSIRLRFLPELHQISGGDRVWIQDCLTTKSMAYSELPGPRRKNFVSYLNIELQMIFLFILFCSFQFFIKRINYFYNYKNT